MKPTNKVKGSDLKVGDTITNHHSVQGKATILKRHAGAGVTLQTESGASVHTFISLFGNYEVVE